MTNELGLSLEMEDGLISDELLKRAARIEIAAKYLVYCWRTFFEFQALSAAIRELEIALMAPEAFRPISSETPSEAQPPEKSGSLQPSQQTLKPGSVIYFDDDGLHVSTPDSSEASA